MTNSAENFRQISTSVSLNGVEDNVWCWLWPAVFVTAHVLPHLLKPLLLSSTGLSCHHFPLSLRVEEQVTSTSTYKMYSSVLPQTGTWSQG